MTDVVVGVDGSQSSVSAVREAAKEAQFRSATLRVICAIKPVSSWAGMGESFGAPTVMTMDDSALLAQGKQVVDDVLASAGVIESSTVVVEVRQGGPARVLIEESSDADLLVVGAGGHSDLGSVLVGSVALHCIHHAKCPVLVVPREGSVA